MARFVKLSARMAPSCSDPSHPLSGPIAEYARYREQNLMSREIQQLCFFAHELRNLLYSKSSQYLDLDEGARSAERVV